MLVSVLLLWSSITGMASGYFHSSSEPVVRAVLFFSPSCGHCHKVIEQDLPPLLEKYGDQLELVLINTITPEGQQLFQNAAMHFRDTKEIRGVPTLIVGEVVLVGSIEIPELFPDIIEAGIAGSGIDWPAIPGLVEAFQSQLTPEASETSLSQVATSLPEEIQQETLPTTPDRQVALPPDLSDNSISETPVFIQRFQQDLVGNSVAVVVLAGMVASIIAVGYLFLRPYDDISYDNLPKSVRWPGWAIPVLCLLGLGVAGYLSYVELTHADAVCGPVGDCNAVQQSPYARLWGVIPIGILGMAGYIAIAIAWGLHRYGPIRWRNIASLGMWGMAMLGTLFSIYLTFLEPFVIGATCAWCIASAVLITLLFWASTVHAIRAAALTEA